MGGQDGACCEKQLWELLPGRCVPLCQLPIPWLVVLTSSVDYLIIDLPCCHSGLPAFKPGEKVEIDIGMDDDI